MPAGFGPQRRSDNEARSSVCRWDLAPGKQRERAGVSRMSVGFGWAEAARMEMTVACAGGICFCGRNQRRGDGRCWACRWDLAHRGAAITRRGRSCAGGIWLEESSETELGSSVWRWDWRGGGGKDGDDGGVCRWDLLLRTQPASEVLGVPVGFGPQRRSDNEARSFVCRWDLAGGKQRE